MLAPPSPPPPPSPPSFTHIVIPSPFISHTNDDKNIRPVVSSVSRSSKAGKSYAAIASSGTKTVTITPGPTPTPILTPTPTPTPTNHILNNSESTAVNLASTSPTVPHPTIATKTETSTLSLPVPVPDIADDPILSPSPPTSTPHVMSLLRLIVKNNPTGVPTFQITTPTPFILSHTFPSTSPYTIIPSKPTTAIPHDLSRTLNTRHIRVQDDLHDMELSNWKKSALDKEDAVYGIGNRRVRLKIYEINDWLISRGWGLLGSHVESYEGGFICDVHTFLLSSPPATESTTKRGGVRQGKKGGGKMMMGTKGSERGFVPRGKIVRMVREEDEECERE